MRVLIAFDKFKDALSATQACEVAAQTLRRKHRGWQFDLCPLTDGGEGFTAALAHNFADKVRRVEVTGPRGAVANTSVAFVAAEKLPARVQGQLPVRGTLAITDLPSASGIALLKPEERDPWHTTTCGLGEALRYAAEEKSDAILLGIGGSATNDLGLGALAALGLRCLRADGSSVDVPTPATWKDIVRLEGRVELPPVFIACDVTNPLLGPSGATATFGPQKGLKPDDVPRLELEMRRMASMLCHHCKQPESLTAIPGTGAAGGIGFGLMVVSGAKLVRGFDLVANWLDLPARIAAADLIITGEGRFDATSLGGKGPGSLVREARRLGKPAHVFAGSLGVEPTPELHAITPVGLPLAAALPQTAEFLAAAVTRVL